MVAAVTHAAPSPTDSHPALARLSDLSLLRARSYVDGQWTGGSAGDGDIFGAQQYAPLLDLPIPA